MMKLASFLIACFFFGASVLGDVYMHNPRGSNDRLFAARETRQNGNRLFDSQNNAKGGYNVGETGSQPAKNESDFYKMVYFQSGPTPSNEDSYLSVELYYQHGCSMDEVRCQTIFQYMCQPESPDNAKGAWEIRDGSNEDTPTFTAPKLSNETAADIAKRRAADLEVSKANGQQESWDSYNQCYMRRRNGGLFIADQTLGRNSLGYSSAVFTRQNPRATRRGYECPEERDYYPYWHPSQWKDLAVWTDNTDADCKEYARTSFSGSNTLGVCTAVDGSRNASHLQIDNSTACLAASFKWVQVYNYLEKAPSYKMSADCVAKTTKRATFFWGIPYDATNFSNPECLVQLPAVQCLKAPWSRPNHLGVDKETGELPRYTWTLPYFPSQTVQRCVLRVRYNMSSSDVTAKADWNDNQVRPNEVADKYKRAYQQKTNEIRRNRTLTQNQQDAAIADLGKTMTDQAYAEVENGQSPVQQNPNVQLWADFPELALAINTDQTSRIFEDRSHAFRLAPRPSGTPAVRIFNLNVRGKRGNNVQVYNALEYDFVPNVLTISSTDLVHIQWTGSNNQPGDGQGKANTDRSNIVQIANYAASYPLMGSNITMWRNAKVYWTMFQSPSLFNIQTTSASATAVTAVPPKNDTKAVDNTALYLNQVITDQKGPTVAPPRKDADAKPYDPEKDLDDGKKPMAMRKKRAVSVTPPSLANSVTVGSGLLDYQLALAMATSGHYWCVNKADCPSYVPDSYISSIAAKALNPTLDEAPASFPGVLVSFKSGTYVYMSTRNNKFSNRSQKGRIKVQ